MLYLSQLYEMGLRILQTCCILLFSYLHVCITESPEHKKTWKMQIKSKLHLIIYVLCSLFSVSGSLWIGEISLKRYKVTSEKLTHTQTLDSSRLSGPCSTAPSKPRPKYTYFANFTYTHTHAIKHPNTHNFHCNTLRYILTHIKTLHCTNTCSEQ